MINIDKYILSVGYLLLDINVDYVFTIRRGFTYSKSNRR